MTIYEMLEQMINCTPNEADELIQKFQRGKIDRVICACDDEHAANSRNAIYILENHVCQDYAGMEGR